MLGAALAVAAPGLAKKPPPKPDPATASLNPPPPEDFVKMGGEPGTRPAGDTGKPPKPPKAPPPPAEPQPEPK